jgi:hypothetical protein
MVARTPFSALVVTGVLAMSLGAGCAEGTVGEDSIDGGTVLPDATKLDSAAPPDGAVGCGNTQTNPQNCGTCGNVCPTGAQCTAGKCACPKGEVCNNACIDTQTDAKNCGACGTVCSGGNSTWSCVAGKCTVGCSGSQTACNNVCVDTSTDNNNCGSCGTTCSGKTCCGSCVDTKTDNNNCGSCGNVCNGGKTCTNSTCTSCDGPSLGSCSHNACKAGGGLQPGCDGNSFCVLLVVGNHPSCLILWDSTCITAVKNECGYTCSGC